MPTTTQVYRITVQKMNADGSIGELVEILETERTEPWTSVFYFVDQYREKYDNVEDEPEPDHHDEVKFCPNCERPNQFGELCASCEADEQATIDAGERWHDEREGNGYPTGTIGAETR